MQSNDSNNNCRILINLKGGTNNIIKFINQEIFSFSFFLIFSFAKQKFLVFKQLEKSELYFLEKIISRLWSIVF
jgi:hypothetical protein